MQIIIIEDEKPTADALARTIKQQYPEAIITAMLRSVKEAIDYFNKHANVDLIFSDIQLGDGLSFEIFKTVKVNTPVVFCTAYDEYALDAFKANGIEYLLKPFTSETVHDAIQKWLKLTKNNFQQAVSYEAILNLLDKRNVPLATSVLVYYKDKVIPIKFDEIALFCIEHEIVTLVTFDNKTYTINKYLDVLEQLAGNRFFRVNRQFLVNRKAVRDAAQFFSQKLSLNLTIVFKDTITVSKDKTSLFLNWLADS